MRAVAAISSMLHAGCGVGGHLLAGLEFADGVECSSAAAGSSVSDVAWRDQRCEPTSTLTVAMSDRCLRRRRPHHSPTLGSLRTLSAGSLKACRNRSDRRSKCQIRPTFSKLMFAVH